MWRLNDKSNLPSLTLLRFLGSGTVTWPSAQLQGLPCRYEGCPPPRSLGSMLDHLDISKKQLDISHELVSEVVPVTTEKDGRAAQPIYLLTVQPCLRVGQLVPRRDDGGS